MPEITFEVGIIVPEDPGDGDPTEDEIRKAIFEGVKSIEYEDDVHVARL